MKKSKIIAAQILLLILGISTLADVPRLINFQGMLKNGAGNPVANGSYSVTFRIYDSPAGGNVLWTETQSVTTTSGLFATILGSIIPVPDSAFNDTARYLSIAVSLDPELSPRQRLVSVGYSYRVGTVDGASGGTITSRVSIGPGHTNTGVNAFVAGENSTASGDNSTIGGGDQNTASDACAAVGGGGQNTASNYYATVGGGYLNTAGGAIAAVGGGSNNTASGYTATVGGGLLNTTSGYSAVVGGGSNNTASGIYATVPGGDENTAAGNNSFAAGYRAKALHDGTFVWSEGTAFSSTGVNQFLISAPGGVGIGTNSPAERLDVQGGAIRVGDLGSNLTLKTTANGGVIIPSPGSSGTSLFLSSEAGGRIEFDINNIEKMRVDNLGNVGIGTSSPAYKLEVSGPMMMGDVSAPSASAGHSGVYSSGGELFAMDAAGNSTQLSPHDTATGEWIFYSKNTKTGRIVRVDMERLVRKIEELTGEQFLMESWEKEK